MGLDVSVYVEKISFWIFDHEFPRAPWLGRYLAINLHAFGFYVSVSTVSVVDMDENSHPDTVLIS